MRTTSKTSAYLRDTCTPRIRNWLRNRNTLEFLGGSQDLISIRGKGSSIRPFTVVREMEIEAFRAQEFWTVKAVLTTPRGQEFEARLTVLLQQVNPGRLFRVRRQANVPAIAAPSPRASVASPSAPRPPFSPRGGCSRR